MECVHQFACHPRPAAMLIFPVFVPALVGGFFSTSATWEALYGSNFSICAAEASTPTS